MLPKVLNQLASGAAHNPDLATSARRGVRKRRTLIAGPIATALAVLVILASVWIERSPDTRPASPVSSACGPLLTTPIPEWARAGFTGQSYPPFVYSDSGDLVAIVFGDPLTAPPAADHNNKILWVTRGRASGDLVITGHLEGTDRTTTIDTGASPGPSIVDMPAAGCWQLNLRYGEHTDSVNLRWAPG
jgi:hypothetical protein